jgi:hypothetical protein
MTLWIDTIPFNGEEVMFTRLKYMYAVVDRFIISEQRFTYTGVMKEFLYTELMKERFKPYLDKITFIVHDKPLKGAWVNENHIRNYPRETILKLYPDQPFILSVCDCDEIPDISKVNKDEIYARTSDGCLYLKQDFHYYNLSWYIGEWTRAFFVNDVILKSTPALQVFRNMSGPSTGAIDCGWHLSYFMSIKDIHRKIVSFAHEELNRVDTRSLENISYSILYGKDLFHRADTILTKNTFVNSYPEEIMELHSIVCNTQKMLQSYTAIIIETREHKALEFVLKNFLSTIDAPFLIFCGNLNKTFCENLFAGPLAEYSTRVRIINMGIDTMKWTEYNRYVSTNRHFYNEIKTEHFLLFQTDTMLFSRYKDYINEFFQYDYVGAPWNNDRYGGVGNGGLSLRRKSKMLEIMDNVTYCGEPEDIYFCNNLLVDMHRPTMEQAKRFSVEEVFHPQTFGCHKPWERGFDKELLEAYPEVLTLFELNNITPQLGAKSKPKA